MKLDTLAIVGVGLIGGSIGKAARERGIARQVVGIETNPRSAQWALDNGLLDKVSPEVPENADLIALCMPSDLVAQWVLRLSDHKATIVDVGSVKGRIVEEIQSVQTVPEQFLPCHPISGSEKSGPQAADSGLFDGCTVVVTPADNSAEISRKTGMEFWQALGANVVSMNHDDHDSALAVTSHLPHLLAFAFMQQVEEKHLPLTGGGFRDFTRIAGANPELWWRIMQLNRPALIEALGDYSKNLNAMADAVARGDEKRGLSLLQAAAAKRHSADSGTN